jgi:hypothetical protein
MTRPACPFLKFQTSNVRSPYRAHPICTSRFCALRFLLYARLPPGQSCKSRKQVERKLKMSSGSARSPSRSFQPNPGGTFDWKKMGERRVYYDLELLFHSMKVGKQHPTQLEVRTQLHIPGRPATTRKPTAYDQSRCKSLPSILLAVFRNGRLLVEKGLGSPAAKYKELRVSLPDLLSLVASITLPNRVINYSYSRSGT